MIKVSVLVPVYNVEKYLRQCMDSLLMQTLREIEIICVNDGSTDMSGEILREYAAQDERIILIEKENTGYGHSMNTALAKARGKYVGILESDDYADVHMYEDLYRLAEKNRCDIAKSNYYEENENLDYRGVYREVLAQCPAGETFCPIEQPQVFHAPLCIWSAVYGREFLQENGIRFNETPGASFQDVSFNFKTLLCAKRVIVTKAAYVHYRTGRGGSSVNRVDKIFCICDEYAEIENFVHREGMGQSPVVRSLTAGLKVRSYLWNYERVAAVFQYTFLERMVREFRRDIDAGMLREADCAADDWDKIRHMLADKMQFFYQSCSQFHDLRIEKDPVFGRQLLQLIRTGFVQTLKGYRQVFVYGAGVRAKTVLRVLQGEVEIAGIFVTNREGNPEKLNGIAVEDTFERVKSREECAVIVAVSEPYQYDIQCRLKENQFSNVFVMYGMLWESIR